VVSIVNQDGSNEGFNDPTPTTPVGGNGGTTLGEQRLIVFQTAAAIWGQVLDSSVEIRVEAQFDSLSCNPFSAVLGSAAALVVVRDFPNAPFSGTWYPVALANAFEGSDLSPGSNDITATFNSRIDNNNGCLQNVNWYLGLDHQHGADIDLLTVVLHELGHGLGFASFVNESTGAEFFGFPDIFGVFSLDLDAGLHWDEMTTNAQRQASAVNTGNLVWNGSLVTNEAAGFLTSGTNGGSVRLYAPNPVQPGSSVSHYDSVASPNLLMEPAINSDLASDLDLSDELMEDIGWVLLRCRDGIDNDDDGFTDFPDDPGCESDLDPTEKDDSGFLLCDDGIDNDDDGFTDFQTGPEGDPGCRDPGWGLEDPQCQDGANNDGKVGTDFDGGESILGAGNGDPDGPDPQCVNKPWRNQENLFPSPRCGLGFELVLLMAPFRWASGRRRRVA
jgi:hypothetical protein